MARLLYIFLTSFYLVLLASFNLYAKDFDVMHTDFPAWFTKDPFNQLDEDLLRAKSTGKLGLMIVYNTEGCSYCALFNKASLSNPGIAKIIRENFESVGLEIFDDAGLVTPTGRQTTIKKFANHEGVMFSPTILFYDTEGKRVMRITGYQSPERFRKSLDYVIGKHYLNKSMAQYLESRNTGAIQTGVNNSLIANKLFSAPPYLLQRNIVPADRTLLVIFESNDCSDCTEFHQKVLANKEVTASLQSFKVVRLDSNDHKTRIITPNGKKLTPASWYRKKGFTRTPALIFYNEKGIPALSTDNTVLKNRMLNSINYMNERAYTKGWSYQRFARTKAIARKIRKVNIN